MNKILIICFMASLLSQSLSAQQNSCEKTAPFVEDFDSFPWRTGINLNHDTCWDISFSNILWYTSATHESDDSSGALLYEKRNVNFVAVIPLSTSSTSIQNSDIISPIIDISALTNPTLQFDYHMVGSDIISLKVFVKNPASNSWVLMDSLINEQQASGFDRFKRREIALPVNDKVHVKFEAKTTGGPHCRMAIDNFKVFNGGCRIPHDPSISNVSTNSVQLNLNTPPGSNIEILCGPAGAKLSHQMLYRGFTSSNTATINNLKPGNFYEVQLRSICGSDTSEWLPSLAFETACPNLFTFPFSEDFNDWLGDTVFYYQGYDKLGGKLNECWDYNKGNGTSYKWVSKNSGKQFTRYPDVEADGGQGIFLTAHYASGHYITSPQPYLISPKIDLNGSVRPELSFNYHSHDSSHLNNMLVAQIGQQSSWQNLDTIYFPSQNNYSSPWKEVRYDLSAFKNDTIQIKFYVTNANHAFSIDNFSIAEKPGCALAGKDTTINVCDTIAFLHLNQFLPTGADTAGYWVDLDASGALYGSDSLATVSLTNDVAYKFQFMIPADSNCTADSAVYTIIRNKLGCSISVFEEELEPLNFNIFPNPTDGVLHIQKPNAQVNYVLQLTNSRGEKVLEKALPREEISEINLQLPPGLYQCLLQNELGKIEVVRKLMIVR